MNSANTDLAKAQSGDDSAFERLHKQYEPLILSLVSQILSKGYSSIDISEEDLRQEAAIALYFAVIAYKDNKDVSFGLYAKICIKNRLYNYLEQCTSKSRFPSDVISIYKNDEGDDGAPDITEIASDEEEPLTAIISSESRAELRKRLKELLTDYEYEVCLLMGEGEKPAAIAAKLGKGVRSVYGTIRRIRKKLEKYLQ